MNQHQTITFGVRYRLERRLGQGGMGTVYQAHDRLNGQRIALKLVPGKNDHDLSALHLLEGSSTQVALGTNPQTAPELLATQIPTPSTQISTVGIRPTTRSALWARVALAHEFRTLAALRHPHIISVLDYGFLTHQDPYFTMELLDRAQTLKIAGKELSLETNAYLLSQLLTALSYLHRHGVLHRDLKPSNVMVVPSAEGLSVKLLDFGLALTRTHAQTRKGEVAGTLSYLAPEVLQGMPVSDASDVFGVGVMMYELLAGRHPFDQRDGGLLNSSIRMQEPDWSPLTDQPKIVSLLKRLLAKSPADRPTAVAALQGLCEATGVGLPKETVALRESTLQAARFVGREEPWSILRQALRTARAGDGQAWLLGGESGVGKSRLMEELRVYALVQGMIVVRGQAAAEKDSAYEVWREIFRSLCLHISLTELEESVLKSLVPDLEQLLEHAIADAPEINAQATQMRLQNVLESLLLRTTDPILVLLEDLQWADAASHALLRRVIPLCQTRPVLLIASYRDDECPQLPRTLPDCQVLKLNRLDAASLSQLCNSMLGDSACPPELVSFLQRETEGNVFFVIEVMRALAEEAGQLSLVGAKQMPDSVLTGGIQAVVHRRLSRLPIDARPLLQLAAVAGRRLDRMILQQFEPNLDSFLYTAADAAVLQASEQSWQFAHDKIRESLLLELPHTERQRLHLAIADSIAKTYPDSASHAAALAEHYASGGNAAKSCYYLTVAGAYALGQGAPEQAAALLDRARSSSCWSQLQPQHAARALHCHIQAQLALGRAKLCTGSYEQLMTVAEVTRPNCHINIRAMSTILVRRLLRSVSQKPFADSEQQQQVFMELAHASRWAVEAYIWNGQPASSVLASLMGMQLSAALNDKGLQAFFHGSLSYTVSLIPLRGASSWLLSRGAALANHRSNPKAALDFARIAGAVQLNQADWTTAGETLDSVIEQSRTVGDEYSLMFALSLRALIAFRSEQTSLFHVLGAELNVRSRRTQSLQWTRFYPLYRGIYALRQGNFQEARLLFKEADGFVQRSKDHHGLIMVGGYLARCELGLGNKQVALEQAKATLALAASVRPTIDTVGEGVAAVAETYLECWSGASAAEQNQLRQPLKQALSVLRVCAFIFPTIRPRCLLWHSRYAQNLGAVRVSKELAKAAITTARQLTLPFDERLALAWLARCDQIPHGFTQGLSAELREFSRIMADLIRNRWEASQDHAESKASSLK